MMAARGRTADSTVLSVCQFDMFSGKKNVSFNPVVQEYYLVPSSTVVSDFSPELAVPDMERRDGLFTSESSRRVMQLLFQAYQQKQRSLMHHITSQQNAVELLDRTRKYWKLTVDENRELKERLEGLQIEADERDRKIRTLTAQLNEARAQLSKQLGENTALKADLDDNVRRLMLVKDVLKDQLEQLDSHDRQQLAFLCEPALMRSNSRALAAKRGQETMVVDTDDDGVDYDQTGDSLDESDESVLRSGRVFHHGVHERRSRSAHAPVKRKVKEEDEVLEGMSFPRKRSKENTKSTEITTTITVDHEGRRASKAKVVIRRSMNRSMSESNLLDDRRLANAVASHKQFSTPRVGTTSTLDLRTPRAESWLMGKPIEGRPHRFEKMNSFFVVTTCDACHKGINFSTQAGNKCKDCNQQCHVGCKAKLALPCVPRSATPRTPSRSRVHPRLQEFCPPSAPMIPAPIIHCVVALERRGLTSQGIYRIPGEKEQVLKVLAELKNSRAVPKLELQDVETITGCIKAFLTDLRDPLIPRTSREEFVRAATTDNVVALNQAICDLPQPNRDTLAYLIVHWHRVIANSSSNKMPLENIVHVLAPTIVGYSTSNLTMRNAQEEVNRQHAVLTALLQMDTEYWQRFLSFDSGAAPPVNLATPRGYGQSRNTGRTTRDESSVNCSLLGPVSSPTKAPLPPLIKPQPRRYFPPPQ